MILSVWSQDGYSWQICGQHRTLRAALAAALRCEQAGGAPHTFWLVTPAETSVPYTRRTHRAYAQLRAFRANR